MDPKVQRRLDFDSIAYKKLAEAFDLYNIHEVVAYDVFIDYFPKKKAAGHAGWKWEECGCCRKFYMEFNEEALEKHWDEMVNSTLPHEVAHIVCYLRPELGKNHNKGWQRVATALGDVNAGERCHHMNLTPARKRRKSRKFAYNVNGVEVLLSTVRHNRTQRLESSYTCRAGRIYPSMFMGEV